MSTRSKRIATVAITAATACCLQATASAQGLIQSAANYVILQGDAVPDGTGAPIAGVTFTNTTVDLPAVDESGAAATLGRLTGTGVVTNNSGAHFHGSLNSNLKMVVRGQDSAPGLPGVIIGTTSSAGLFASIRLTSDGRSFFGATLSGSGTTISNDTALIGGPLGSLAVYVREGDVAPGTVGANMTSSMTGLGLNNAALNSNGRVAFKSTLSGGDVVGTTNDEGWFDGTPGALNLVVRKGDGIISGETIGAFQLGLQMNAAGQFVYDATLSTTVGTPVATNATNYIVSVHTPGFGSTIIAREGDAAPGTTGAVLANATNDNWTPFRATPAFTRSGKVVFWCNVSQGDTVAGVNDQAIYVWDGTSLNLVVRSGMPAPGTDANFSGFTPGTVQMLDDGRVTFTGALTGGTSTTADDSGIWFGQPGSLALVVREGDAAPGSGGGTHGALGGTFIAANDLGQIVFTTQLFPSTNPAVYAWQQGPGDFPIILNSEVIDIGGGNMRTIGALSTSFVQNNNSDGAALGFSHSGVLAMRLNFASPFSSERALMTIQIPNSTPPTAFCFGDGSGTVCPCANSGAAGHGCASSSFAGGSRLTSSGIAGASAGTDTLVLTAYDMAGPGLFFQGTGQLGGGAGNTFGDGLLCIGGSILRLGVVFPTSGSASYPGGLTPNPIHVGGATASGDVRHYQVWYRDSAAFCDVATFNLTQGLTLTWVP